MASRSMKNEVGDVVVDTMRSAARAMKGTSASVTKVGRKGRRNKGETQRIDRFDSPGGKGPVLELKYKATWGPKRRRAMDEKVRKFNEAVAQDGFKYVPGSHKRSGSLKDKFLQSIGLKRQPSKMDVDHIRDLQAGGTDSVSNMWLLDRSVNRSFGSQLRARMDSFPPNTIFGGVIVR